MSKQFYDAVTLLSLLLMFFIIFFSAWNDSAIMDELAHIPAGYSYVKLKDMRLNPEHPPLIKDLAGIGLLPLNPHFPTNTSFWREDVNGQWAQGTVFLYEAGNNPDTILLFSRLGIMLLAFLFGWLLYKWAYSLYGPSVALLTTFLYAFSPTFLAHSRYVTTDLAAAFGFFIGLATFMRFLEKQTSSRLLLAGLAFGFAQLLKFSLFLLIPVYGILTLLWLLVQERERSYEIGRREKVIHFFKEAGTLLVKLAKVALLGLALIWLVYGFHVWNYPQERQFRDAEFILSSFGIRELVKLDLWMIQHEFLRPLGQYLLGLLMVVQRAAGGNTTYYFGEVSAAGWRSYFPLAYLMKETIALHLLTLFALALALRNIKNAGEKSWQAVKSWIRDNFGCASSLVFIAFYWIYSIQSPLNIGVRHVLPTFPFIYLLVSRELVRWVHRPHLEEHKTLGERLGELYRRFLEPVPKLIVLTLLLLWIFATVIVTFPFYLSYYNETIGIKQGYRYIVDSNYDWGQDLKRLRDLVERENIPKIYLDYFGGGSPGYYLKGRYVEWWSAKGPPPPGSLFAVSATLLQGAQGWPVKGFQIKSEDRYSWLEGLTPIRRAGLSIFIYRIP